jgi:septum formation protein
MLILASASPRRADLLRAAGLPFEVCAADVDETREPDEAPDAYVRRLAVAKGRTLSGRYADRLVVAADTTVVVGGDVLEKPADVADAARMLRLLAGRSHEVLTAVCLLRRVPPVELVEVVSTTVEVGPLSEAEIAWYVASAEPMGKAGGYAVQGLASRFITRIDGSYANVVGLPVATVYRMCTAAGMLLS